MRALPGAACGGMCTRVRTLQRSTGTQLSRPGARRVRCAQCPCVHGCPGPATTVQPVPSHPGKHPLVAWLRGRHLPLLVKLRQRGGQLPGAEAAPKWPAAEEREVVGRVGRPDWSGSQQFRHQANLPQDLLVGCEAALRSWPAFNQLNRPDDRCTHAGRAALQSKRGSQEALQARAAPAPRLHHPSLPRHQPPDRHHTRTHGARSQHLTWQTLQAAAR